MKKPDTITIGIIIVTIAIFGIIIAAASLSSPNTPTEYSSSEIDRPKLEISQRDFDLGKMKQDEIKTEEISIKNTGTKPLTLRNFTTSCGCTTIQLDYLGEKTQEFSMHYNAAFTKDIAPNDTAKIIVKYDPSAMPVEGKVERTAFFKTNDPENLDVKISLTAFVEK